MAQTDDFDLCHQYLTAHIEDIKKQMDQYRVKLTKQAELYPIISTSLVDITSCLKELVVIERKYILKRNNKQLGKFKENIEQNRLLENITTYHRTIDQVR